MRRFFWRLLVTAGALGAVAWCFDGITCASAGAALITAAVFMTANAVVKPFVLMLSLPLLFLSLGLFYFAVNALLFWAVAAFVPGFAVTTLGSALGGSLALSLILTITP